MCCPPSTRFQEVSIPSKGSLFREAPLINSKYSILLPKEGLLPKPWDLCWLLLFAAKDALDVPRIVSHDDVKQDLSSKTHNYFPDILLSHAPIHSLGKVAKNKPLPTDPNKLTKLRGVTIPSRGGMVPTHALSVGSTWNENWQNGK